MPHAHDVRPKENTPATIRHRRVAMRMLHLLVNPAYIVRSLV